MECSLTRTCITPLSRNTSASTCRKEMEVFVKAIGRIRFRQSRPACCVVKCHSQPAIRGAKPCDQGCCGNRIGLPGTGRRAVQEICVATYLLLFCHFYSWPVRCAPLTGDRQHKSAPPACGKSKTSLFPNSRTRLVSGTSFSLAV